MEKDSLHRKYNIMDLPSHIKLDKPGKVQLEFAADGELSSLMDCASGDAAIHLMLLPATEAYGVPQTFSLCDGKTATFTLLGVPVGEYAVRLRRVECCGHAMVVQAEEDGTTLPEAMVNETIRKCYMQLADKAFEYAYGFATREDFYVLARNTLYGTNARNFAEFSSLRFRFNLGTWERAQEDYKAWRRGESPCSTKGEPWLVTGTSNEACALDKIQFFRLLTAFHVDLDFFEPVPAAIVDPGKEHVHTYHGSEAVRIQFHCVDDGGLLSAQDPCGRTFELRSDKGLRAVLRIKDANGTYLPQINTFGSCFDYRCEGWVEGFTAKDRGDSDIYIMLSESGTIENLGLFMNGRDYGAYSSYPLWQNYLKWQAEKMRRFREGGKVIFYRLFLELPGHPVGQPTKPLP